MRSPRLNHNSPEPPGGSGVNLEIASRRHDGVGDQLASNAERIAWGAHKLASEIADRDATAVTHALRRAATEQWRRLYFELA